MGRPTAWARSRLRPRAAAIALPAVLAACTYLSGTPPYKPEGIGAVGRPDTGADWYRRDCAWCHGARAEGTARGPSLQGDRNGPALTDFMLRTGRMPIADPSEPIRRHDVQYPQATIDKIVNYLATIGPREPTIPRPDPASGDIPRGELLYQANCAACHSATGIGGALAQGSRPATASASGRGDLQAPGLERSTPVEIAEAMLTGPGTMPVFSDETLSAADRDAIIRYVMYLQHAQDRGGADLGRVGPVAEGAVAWILGLGAIVLLSRMIGRSVREHG